MYGVPHGWGANLLMYRTDDGEARADQLGRGVRRRVDVPGKVTAYDSPIYIADAALYLMNTQPDLGIKDPYALDQTQLAAAVDAAEGRRGRTSRSTGRTTSRRCRPSRPATP